MEARYHMQEISTMEIIVHKQNIPTIEGETLNQFSQRLSDAAKKHLLFKLNIAKDKGYVWPIEIYSDYIVMSGNNDGENARCYAFTYTRKKDGNFDFGNTTEVERAIEYKPINGGISKSWAETSKNLWKDIL
jgi:hypothetical protein